jgi:hypothetical protein
MPPTPTPEKRINVRTPEGDIRSLPESLVDQALEEGFQLVTPGDRTSVLTSEAREEDFGGVGGAIGAGGAGLLRGATFGLSDVIRRASGADPVEMRAQKEAHPTLSTATEVAGAVVPSLLTGGAGAAGTAARLTPAGAASRLALGTTERIAGQAPSALRYAGAAATGGAVEGALQNVGSYVSDVALKNKELSAEGALGALGSGGLWGGLAGGAFAGIEKGTIAARRLFPRSEAGEATVHAAEQEFVAAGKDAVRAGDELAKTARQRLDDIDLKRAELNLEKLKLKGQTDPAAAERLAQIRVQQAEIKIARRAAAGEVAAVRASKAAVKPEDVPLLPPGDPVIPPAAADIAPSTPALAGVDDLEARLAATQGLLDEGVPFADIGAAARRQTDDAVAQIDDAIKAADDEHARISAKLERFQQGRPMADDFIARYGGGAKSKYSATGGGGTRGGGVGPVRTDRTRLLPDEEVEASINDRVFAGIGGGQSARGKLPRGFDYGPPGPDAPVRRGMPSPDEAFDENTIYVAKAGDFKRAGLRPEHDTGFTEKQVDSIKSAWSKDRKLDPIKAGFDENGDLVIIDGRHRLAAAADDQEIAVRLHPFSDEPGQAMGAGGPSAMYADATATRGGRALDDAYESAIERAATAPNRAAQERALREAADLEDQIFDTVASRGRRDADDVAKIRNKRGDLGQDSYTVAMRRAEKRALADDLPAQSDKAAAARADLEAYDRGLRGQQFAGGKTAGQAADDLLKLPLADQILGPAPAVAAAAESTAQGARLNRFLDDADEAIRVVGELEKATAELAQELGEATPPKAKALADQYWAAVDDQSRKLAERTAMSADDAVRAGQMVTLPKAPPAPASEARRLGKGVADAAAMLDTIQTFGDIPGMPNARDLPVVGPILSMYLKVRAGRMALSRIGGRIPATAEAKVAAKSAELRDRAAAVVDRILVGAEKTAKTVRRPVVVTGAALLDTLSTSLYPHDEEKRRSKPATPSEAVKDRVRELSAAASNPEQVKAAVRGRIQANDPDVVTAIEAATLRKLAYLHKHAPKMPAPGLLAGKPWTPGKMEIEKFARRVRAAEDPVSVLDELEAGTLTPEAADTLRTVYPALFSDVQMRLLSRAAELEVTVPYRRRLTISALFDVPLDDSLRPSNVAGYQQIYTSGGASPDAAGAAPGGPQQPPAPSVAAPVNVSRLYADTRANRR